MLWKPLCLYFRQSTFSTLDVFKTIVLEPCQKNLATGGLIAMLFRDVHRPQRGLGTQCLECSMQGNAGLDRWLMWRTKSTELRPNVLTELVGVGHKTCTGLLVSDRLVTSQVSPCRSFHLLDISEKRFFFTLRFFSYLTLSIFRVRYKNGMLKIFHSKVNYESLEHKHKCSLQTLTTYNRWLHFTQSCFVF